MFRLFSFLLMVVLSTPPLFADILRISENPTLQQSANAISMSIEIDAPIDEVWRTVGIEFGNSAAFNNDATSTVLISNGPVGVGTQRRTNNTNGTFFDVEIFEYRPSDYLVAWEIIASDLGPVSYGYSQYQLVPLAANRTKLTQISGFRMDSSLMDFMMRSQFPRILRTELSGLKRFVETGERVQTSSPRQIRSEFGIGIQVQRNW